LWQYLRIQEVDFNLQEFDPIALIFFSVAYYFPASVNYHPYPDYTPASAIDHPDLNLSVSLSKT
jgi:hypothetical protein